MHTSWESVFQGETCAKTPTWGGCGGWKISTEAGRDSIMNLGAGWGEDKRSREQKGWPRPVRSWSGLQHKCKEGRGVKEDRCVRPFFFPHTLQTPQEMSLGGKNKEKDSWSLLRGHRRLRLRATWPVC